MKMQLIAINSLSIKQPAMQKCKYKHKHISWQTDDDDPSDPLVHTHKHPLSLEQHLFTFIQSFIQYSFFTNVLFIIKLSSITETALITTTTNSNTHFSVVIRTVVSMMRIDADWLKLDGWMYELFKSSTRYK